MTEGDTSTAARPTCPACGFGMVRRERRSDGQPFWGCPRFPQCRGTRRIEERSEPSLPGRAENRDRPGASAQRQFERRRVRHEERVRAETPDILLRGGAIAIVGLGIAMAAPESWHLLGWALVVLAVVGTATRLFVLPQHVAAWGTGGDGEERTARYLDPLRGEGFVVFHDRRPPMSVANIDHIVVGPTGVWVVETKSYKGRIRADRGELVVDGRRRPGVRDEVVQEAEAVLAAIRNGGFRGGSSDAGVKPIVVVHRGDFPLLGWPNLGGVPVVTGRELVKRIRRGPVGLTPEEVAEVAALVDRGLPPALRG